MDPADSAENQDPRAAGPIARFADAATWRRLLSAPDAAAFSEAWLAVFCAQIDLTLAPLLGTAVSVRQGMVALGDPESNRYGRTAWYGDDREVSLLLAKAAERAMQVRHGTVQPGDAITPCQLAHPVMVGQGLHGVIAIELVPQAREHLDLVMRYAQWGVTWFTQFYRPKDPDRPDAEIATLQVEALEIAGSGLSIKGASEALCTHLADKLQLRKVSLGYRRRLSTRLLAVSHGGFAGVINDYLAALVGAMDESADFGDVLWPVPADALATPSAAHAKLSRIHECDWALTLRLLLPAPFIDGGPILTLTAEGEGLPDQAAERRLRAVMSAVSPLVVARIELERSLTGQMIESVGGQLRLLVSRRGWRRQLLLASVAAVVVALAFVNIDYRVSADATLEGLTRRAVVAPFDGYLADASARPGDRVQKGAQLGRLDDRDIAHQKLDLEEKLAETEHQITEAVGQLDNAKVNILSARKAGFQAEIAVVQGNMARANLTAPFDAFVVSGDKTQSIGAPVRRGDVLYELSPLEGFRVDVEVPQADFAEIGVGQGGELLLSSMSYQSFPIRLTRITPIASAKDGKTEFEVDAQLLRTDPVMRPGMQGVAEIDLGRRKLGWVLSHRIADWVRLKLWAWMP